MKRRALVSWVAGAAAVAAAAGFGFTRALHFERQAPAAAPDAAAVAAAPQSCKVVPPVRVTLAPGATPDVWRVHVEAIESAPAVTVTLGSRAGDRDGGRTLVWSGALAAGASRDFEARFAPGEGATRVWAEADAAATPGGALRSMSGLDLQHGKVVTGTAAAANPGRLVQNPQTGETVFEYEGASGGRR